MSNTNIANDNDEREPEWVVCYRVFGATIIIAHYKTEEEANHAKEVDFASYGTDLRVEERIITPKRTCPVFGNTYTYKEVPKR
tara:strand:- start:222 stop:470 length:249 start_codon:yes stop_codon:yes gene_type:complete